MICKKCDALISCHEVASTLLYRATLELQRLAGKSQPDLFIAVRRKCVAYREECIRTSIALRTHRESRSCTSASRGLYSREHPPSFGPFTAAL